MASQASRSIEHRACDRAFSPKATTREGHISDTPTLAITKTETIRLDDQGLPLVRYGEEFFYNPVTLAQRALAEFSRDGGPTPLAIVAVDKLLELQDDRGAFLYDFPFLKYAHGQFYEPGWSSGMAQGQALSALARAYELTGDAKYLAAGEAALQFIEVPRADGGPLTNMADLDPALPTDLPFIMEYPADPTVYTLNGFMFAMLGLYDWAQIAGSEEAGSLFDDTLATLELLLPYYDLETFSSYDLSFLTLPTLPDGRARQPHIGIAYHAVHIELLWALNSVSDRDALSATADRWQSYVE